VRFEVQLKPQHPSDMVKVYVISLAKMGAEIPRSFEHWVVRLEKLTTEHKINKTKLKSL